MSNKKGIVTADKLNVRSGSATEFSAIAQLFSGTKVDIVKTNADWKKIDLSSIKGYISRANIVLHDSSPDSDGDSEFGIVEAEALNIRTGKGYEYPVVTTINQNSVLKILKESSEWYLTKTQLLKGFIREDLLIPVIGGGQPSGGAYLAAVNEEFVNLRSGKGLDFSVLAVLTEDTRVNVKHSSNGWVEIETVVYQGYIRKEFVRKITSSQGDANNDDVITTGLVSGDSSPLLTGPGSNYQLVAALNAGMNVDILDITSAWIRVKIGPQPAYVFGKYIRELSSSEPDLPVGNDPLAPDPGEFIDDTINLNTIQIEMVNTWNRYGGLIKQISARHSISSDVALSVLCVESGGKGFGPDGRLLIRFENHHFYRYWGEQNDIIFARHFKFNPDFGWKNHEFRLRESLPWQPVHNNRQTNEWLVFELASQLDSDSALQSISMGCAQILGSNYRMLGYVSAEQMFDEFQSDIRFQIIGFFSFIQARNLIPAIISEDFYSFAKAYNGPSNAEVYSTKIKKYLDEFRSISS